MEFIQHDSFDWEPSCFTVHCGSRSRASRSEIEAKLLPWVRERERESICNCELSFLKATVVGERSFELTCERLCKKCLPSFLRFVERKFDGVERIEAGSPAEPAQPDRDHEFVAVEAKTVEFENGVTSAVETFEISRYPVSIRDFDRFVRETKYVTIAEQLGEEDTYKSNGGIEGLSGQERWRCPVTCVSYLDASEFCQWNGTRLPTEAEWMAAAVVEDELLEYQAWTARKFGLVREPRYLQQLATELAGLLVDDPTRCVIRRGPKWARTTDWRESMRMNRITAPLDAQDLMTAFRVVRRAGE